MGRGTYQLPPSLSMAANIGAPGAVRSAAPELPIAAWRGQRVQGSLSVPVHDPGRLLALAHRLVDRPASALRIHNLWQGDPVFDEGSYKYSKIKEFMVSVLLL